MDYKKAGVNIEAGNQAVDLIKNSVERTYDKNVLNALGGFGAFYALPKYKEPVLISCTDGVGTKLKIAIELQKFDTVGIDLVAMNVNDLICCGGKPLFFLDYLACHQLQPEQVKQLIDGMVEGCLQAGCALIGGEMAEMNDLYKKGDYDLAGFAVGVVEKKKRLDGTQVKPGQYLYAFASSGVHSNGFSLVRRVLSPAVCKQFKFDYADLLIPTKIYVKPVLKLLAKQYLTAIAHITGGGIQENLIRVLPQGVQAVIQKKLIRTPQVFEVIQAAGKISQKEMYRVFNMGIGMIVVSNTKLRETKDFYQIGTIEAGERSVALV